MTRDRRAARPRQSCGCGHEASLARRRQRRRPRRVVDAGLAGRSPGVARPRAGGAAPHRLLGGAAAATRLLDGLRAELAGRPGHSTRRSSACWTLPAPTMRSSACSTARSVTCAKSCAAGRDLTGRARLFDGLNLVALSNTTSQLAAPAVAGRELPAPAGPGRAGVDRLRPGVAAGRAGQGARPTPASAPLTWPASPGDAREDLLRSAMGLRAWRLAGRGRPEYPARSLIRRAAPRRRRRGEPSCSSCWRSRTAAGGRRLQRLPREQSATKCSATYYCRLALKKYPPARGAGAEVVILHQRACRALAATKRMGRSASSAAGGADDLSNALGPPVAPAGASSSPSC